MIWISGCCKMTSRTSVKRSSLTGSTVSLSELPPSLKWTCRRITISPVVTRTSFGQPFLLLSALSAAPRSFGHASSTSAMPSPSPSLVGQPFLDGSSFVEPFTFGHASWRSAMPSRSVSTSPGQPLRLGSMLETPFWFGQASSLSGTPSRS